MQGITKASRPQFSQRTHTRSLLSIAILGGLLAVSSLAAAQSGNGQIGNPDSWRNDEFNADWGLATINAQYAYARGLTGKGVRLGVYDSGTVLAHPEFAGKDNRAIQMADLLDDGTFCTNTSIVSGPGACFSSRGDQAQVTYVGFNANVPDNIRRIITSGPYVQPGWEYGSHGTHVGGTIAANRDGNGMHGVSFGSDLSVAKWAFNSAREWQRVPTGGYSVVSLTRVSANDDTIARMYQDMNDQGVRALNHSWGLANEPGTLAGLDDILNDPDNASYFDVFAKGSLDKGLLQVWAAGNHNVAGVTPETSPQAGLYASLPRARPDLEPYWLTVVNITPELTLSNRSMRCAQTANWCVAAPGSVIRSTVVGGSDALTGGLVKNADGSISFNVNAGAQTYEYDDMSGTSMAAPHVTGSLGLLFERFPYLASTQVRDILLTTATDLGAAGVDEVYGWGLINLQKAIDGPGQIRVDTDVVMDRPGGGAKVWTGKAWDDWRNDIGGPGVLTKSGIGWLRLSGNNRFGGLNVKDGVLELTGNNSYAAQVEGGTLVVNGTLTSAQLPILKGGALGGSGRIVGDVRVDGAVSPGNSIGTLTVQGDYTQAAGSTYVAELSASGQSDRIDVTGKAALEGGKLVVLHAPGQYLLGQNFNLISAAGGVSGQFAAIDQTSFSPFLKFGLAYSANQVGVEVTRGAAIASAAKTDNQRAAAGAADQLAIAQGLAQPLTQLFPQQALAALDSLSGEGHASLRSIMIDDSRHIRDAALVRARAGRGEFAADGDGASQGAWIQVLKSGGTLDGDGNAARNEYNGSATLLGYDYRFDSGWRIGVLGGNGRTDSNNDRLDKGRIKSTHLGVYGGQNWGKFNLSAGFSFARQDVDLERRIGFNGFVDRTRASYDADSKQGFVEGGYRFNAGAWEFEPYAQFAQVRVSTDAFQESGGAAALSGRSADSRVNLSTLGLRFNVNLKGSQQDDSWLSLRGGLGRRHASGDLTPETAVAWRGGNAFTVSGAPLGEDANLVEAGIAARLSANGLLELSYSGQFADEAHDHGINARYSLRF
ncbi:MULTISPECIES: autotransporter domain-containing protein [Lysobacter]|uniref:autotransporter domain-containing protein n=1 Tax=Lysobacter TaxID=68 RepID=UPI001F2F3BC4|nr:MULTISPECIES: autotransporter serine protease [Lysobacter]UJB19844.1 autotransporter domain-containing protein [Lysobacter capsici]UJQ26430.1 autotransporter domain-containing protein [Lysobacter gummosus]